MVDRQLNEFYDRTFEKYFLGSNCSEVIGSVSTEIVSLLFVSVASRCSFLCSTNTISPTAISIVL